MQKKKEKKKGKTNSLKVRIYFLKKSLLDSAVVLMLVFVVFWRTQPSPENDTNEL